MQNIKDLLKGVKENVSLASYTTFKIGGPARYFYVAKTTNEILEAIKFARKKNLPYYILGGSSKVLVSDKGFDGLIIKFQVSSFKFQKNRVIAEAGVALAKLVSVSIANNLTGLEWVIGIPGTVGGAIFGNAGAFGHSISEVVESVEVLDCGSLTKKIFSNSECYFDYRESIFKKVARELSGKGVKKYVILSVVLKLEKGDREKSEMLMNEYLAKRSQRQPKVPSAGSVFKNIAIKNLGENQLKELYKKCPQIKEKIKEGFIPAGFLIDQVGLRGKKIGDATVSEVHGNFIVNAGKAKAKDVVILISLIKQKVRVNFGIQLEEEIGYVGF